MSDSDNSKGLSDSERMERALNSIEDPEKRETLRKLISGAAFVAPVVMSFAIDGLTIGPALAFATNGTHS